MKKTYISPAQTMIVLQSNCICTLQGSLNETRKTTDSFEEGVESDVKSLNTNANIWDNEW